MEGGPSSLSYSVTEFRFPGRLSSASPSLCPRGVIRPLHGGVGGTKDSPSPPTASRRLGTFASVPSPSTPSSGAGSRSQRAGRGGVGAAGPSGWPPPGLASALGWVGRARSVQVRSGTACSLVLAGWVVHYPSARNVQLEGSGRNSALGLLSPLWNGLSFSYECGGCGDLESIKSPGGLEKTRLSASPAEITKIWCRTQECAFLTSS